MLTIKSVVDYTIPLFGNKRCFPYGKLAIEDENGLRRVCPIKDEGGRQYITFNRNRYYVRRVGDLYAPCFVFADTNTGFINERS